MYLISQGVSDQTLKIVKTYREPNHPPDCMEQDDLCEEDEFCAFTGGGRHGDKTALFECKKKRDPGTYCEAHSECKSGRCVMSARIFDRYSRKMIESYKCL